MTRLTRRSVLAALAGVSTAGCLSDSPGRGNSTEKTTPGQSPSPTETTEVITERATTGETTSQDWIAEASNTPDPDHSISVRNESSEAQSLRLRIVREKTNETVFDVTKLDSVGEADIYNLKQADPEGVESFRVCAELVDVTTVTADATATTDETATETATSRPEDDPRRDCVTIQTSECYGNAYVTVRDDEVEIIYAIC